VIEEVHILVDDDGEFISPTHFCAWKGFTLRGRDVRLKTSRELDGQLHPARRDVLVFGGVYHALAHLTALGCAPEPLDYPPCLRNFLGRKIEPSTLGEIRRRFGEIADPIFIKPIAQKRFTGHVVSRFRDLLKTVGFEADEPLYTSPVLDLLSEWRVYVHKGEVVGIGHYKGDPLLFPEEDMIKRAVHQHTLEGAPIAYGMDFGVFRTGANEEEWYETALVEANDMIALGNYGLFPMLYSTMIEDRWLELVGS